MRTTPGPVFVVGSSKSGTTLVSACLNRSRDIHIARETHYFDDLRPRLLARRRSMPTCAIGQEAITYFRKIDSGPYGHTVSPQESDIDPRDLQSLAQQLGCSPDSYFQAYCVLKARAKGKIRWGEKTPRHVYRANDILQAFPLAKIVCVIRDPRAVVASYRDWQTPCNLPERRRRDFARDDVRARRSYHLFIISLMWRSAVRTIARLMKHDGNERVRVIRYEDVVLDPEGTLRALCDFLATQFTREMLQTPLLNSSYSADGATIGITMVPLYRWREKLSRREVAAIQACCGREMELCGYELDRVGSYVDSIIGLSVTFPFAVVRALAVNRSRIASLRDYLRRRLAPLGTAR